jgi:protein-disulfide isomerase
MPRRVTLNGAANGILTVCAVVLTGFVVWTKLLNHGTTTPPPPPSPRVLGDSTWQAVEAVGHWTGTSSAPVVIVEFGDFECPFCAAFANRALRGVLAEYSTDVALDFRHWPLPMHRLAYPAARAAECAGAQGRFNAYADVLFAKHDSLGIISFDQFAVDAGVPDRSAFDSCNASGIPVPAIERDSHEALAIGARGTPTVIINGTLYYGTPDSVQLDTLVRAALAKTRMASK